MRTIRRLYFYAVALISLEVVLWGVIELARSIVSDRVSNTAEALAQALALILVGVPVFLFHWLWLQRAAARDEEERTASLRAIFFYAVLAAALVPVAQNLLALIDRLILGIVRLDPQRALLGSSQSWQDNLIAIGVNLIVTAYFWDTLRQAWASLPEEENFADVRRLYRYLWLLYGLLMVIFGAQQVLRYVFYIPVPENFVRNVGSATFANGLALLIVGTPIWIYTWRIIQDAKPAPVEMGSNLRLGVLYLLALGGVITVLTAGGMLLDTLLSWIMGESLRGHEVIRRIGDPLALGLPMAGVWAYYGGWLGKQIASDEDDLRRASKKRFYYYILSALGLGAAFIGIAMLLSFVIDLLASTAFWGNTMRSRLAASVATLSVGLPLWLLTWRPMQTDALSEGVQGEHARRSVIRRVYLYMALFAGVIGGMASAVALVFLVINSLLTGEFETDFVANMVNTTALLALFAVLLVYHLNNLRQDGKMASATLEARQRDFTVMVLDPGDEQFVKTVAAAMGKHAPDVPLVVQAAAGKIEQQAQAVILPASQAVDAPDALRKWLKGFSGEKIVVSEAVSGWVLTGLSPEQAAKSARQVAEGEKVQFARPSALWEVLKTVAVILLGIELLFLLFGFGMSLIMSL